GWARRKVRSRAAPMLTPSSCGRTLSATRATVGLDARLGGTNGVAGTASAKRIAASTCQYPAAVKSPVGSTSTLAPRRTMRRQREKSTNPRGARGVDHAKKAMRGHAFGRTRGGEKVGTREDATRETTATRGAGRRGGGG